MKEKVLNLIKESKAIILVIIGVLTAIASVLGTSESVVESIPVKADSVFVVSITPVTVTSDSI